MYILVGGVEGGDAAACLHWIVQDVHVFFHANGRSQGGNSAGVCTVQLFLTL